MISAYRSVLKKKRIGGVKKPLNTLAECLSVTRQEAATGDRHRRSHECNGYGSWKQIDGLLMSG